MKASGGAGKHVVFLPWKNEEILRATREFSVKLSFSPLISLI
jgi:hypothetical protein